MKHQAHKVMHAYHGAMEKAHGFLKDHAKSKDDFVHHSGNEQWHKMMKNNKSEHESGGLESKIKSLAAGAPGENQIQAWPAHGGQGSAI